MNGAAKVAPFRLANAPAFAGARVGDGLVADPAFINRLSGALVTRVGRDAQSVGLIVETAMHEMHAEGDEIAHAPFRRGEPAAAEFGAQGGPTGRANGGGGPTGSCRYFVTF